MSTGTGLSAFPHFFPISATFSCYPLAYLSAMEKGFALAGIIAMGRKGLDS
jgi:hypothetical protein